MTRHGVSALAALLVCCNSGGAGPAASPAPTDGAAAEPRESRAAASASQPAAPEAPPSPQQLMASNPDWPPGEPCGRDYECTGALRCIGRRCAFPPAMTGVRDHATPMAVFGSGPGESMVWLEVADDEFEHTRGLMFRRSMAPSWGMVFVFDDEAPRSFWMKNTLLELDMLFVRSDGTIDSIVERAEPLTLAPRQSRGPARFVIELLGGEARRRGLAPGQHVELLNLANP